MTKEKVCTLDEAFNHLGLCPEDRMYDFFGCYQTFYSWTEEHGYMAEGETVYKITEENN